MENDEEEDDLRDYTQWVFLVNPDNGAWCVTQQPPPAPVGQYEQDMSREGNEWYVAATFDQSVEAMLKALTEIGGGSIEGNQRIVDLISGVARSFVEAQANLKKWQTEGRPKEVDKI